MKIVGINKRVVYSVIGSLIILFTLALLMMHTTKERLITSIINILVVLLLFLAVMLDKEFSVLQLYALVTGILNIAFLVLFNLSQPTLTTIFTGIFVIFLYIFFIVLTLVKEWYDYKFFDNIIKKMEGKR